MMSKGWTVIRGCEEDLLCWFVCCGKKVRLPKWEIRPEFSTLAWKVRNQTRPAGERTGSRAKAGDAEEGFLWQRMKGR